MNTQPMAQRFRIEGRVQGVGYRASAQRAAAALGLTGWVRNLPDGAVEAYAVGASDQLSAFADWLWQGPRLAHVTSVQIEGATPEKLTTFGIRA